MQRQHGGLIPIGEALADLPDPVQAIREASPQALHHFTRFDQVNQLVSASEADPERGFMARTMALCSLPRTNPGDRLQYRRVNGPYKLIMIAGGDNKLPYGNLPRLILAWLSTEAVKTQSRELVLGRSLSKFMRTLTARGGSPRTRKKGTASRLSHSTGIENKAVRRTEIGGSPPIFARTHFCHGRLGINSTSGGARGEQTRLRNQMNRLFGCTVQLIYEDANSKRFISSLIADRGEFWWNERKPDEPVLWDSKIELGEKFFHEIISHPVPLDMNTLTALKRSTLGLDLYLWLVYRTFPLRDPLRLTWKQVYRQFGAHPANASDKQTVQNFRREVLRELKKIKLAWPELRDGSGRPDPLTLEALHTTGRAISTHWT